jgi:hypothetical protein
MKNIELKYPIEIIVGGKKTEIRFLTPSRLKMKHIELLPKSLMEKSENGNLSFSTTDMIPIFNDLVPFLAAIFNVQIEEIKDIDFEDIENVLMALDEVFPKDEKKN